MISEVAVKFIDKVRTITGDAVSKKQDAAKLNFPKIQEDIMVAADRGESEIRISTSRMNEYDKALLVKEGFSVSLVNIERSPYENDYKSQLSKYDKEWLVRW